MFYKRKFLVNEKPPENWIEGDFLKAGTSKEFVFRDVETGYKFKSFFEMYNYFNYDNNATTESYGTSAYHYDIGIPFAWTDGVSEIIERNEAYWILSLIGSYYLYVSETMVKADANGRLTFVANPNIQVADNCDNFLQISILKLSEDTAFFSIDVENWNKAGDDTEYKTIACQYIPYTDLKDDHIYLFGESGLLLHPQEH